MKDYSPHTPTAPETTPAETEKSTSKPDSPESELQDTSGSGSDTPPSDETTNNNDINDSESFPPLPVPSSSSSSSTSKPTRPNQRTLPKTKKQKGPIREVWATDLREEFKAIRNLVNKSGYTVIAMDTEFPGIVTHPIAEPNTPPTVFNYAKMRDNCNSLNVIQLGISIMNIFGNVPESVSTWQFNFSFDLDEETHNEDSVAMLKRSGIKFWKHKTHGIKWEDFSEMLMSSDLVLNEDITWVVFHGVYDVGYLWRILSGRKIPDEAEEFFELVDMYFPVFYDIKCVIEDIPNYGIRGSLQHLANVLKIQRVGSAHQAGSDSLITGRAFFGLLEKYLDGKIDSSKYKGKVYSL